MLKTFTLLTVSLLLIISVFAQEGKTVVPKDESKDAFYKPRIGLSAGVFTFFGEVRDNTFSHLFTSSMAYEVNVGRNISKSFALELRVMHGNMKVNERGIENNHNFSSNIWNGSANLVYNFDNFYKKPKVMMPFLSVGLGYLSFDSKTDLLSSTGIPYQYWSDGTIRSIDENSPQAEDAVILQRDYDYETDLRQQNLDSLGKYKLFSMSIPVSGGVNFRVGNRFTMRLSTTYYINFTDMIDNISDAGEGNRKGNSAKDNFLFTSLGLSYSLWGDGVKTERDKYFDDIDFSNIEIDDSDGDGVLDFLDRCANTPLDEGVDENGCPLDTDVDYIAGKQDRETTSASGALVNTSGITYNDSIIAKEQEDSIAVPRKMISVIYPSGTDSRKVSPLKSGDMELLSQKVELIQQDLQRNDDLDNFFESVSEEVKRKNISDPKAIEQVFKSVNGVYTELTKLNPEMNKTLEVTAQKTEQQSTIPAQFLNSDANEDGLLTADEVLRVVEQFLDGASSYSLPQVYELIDYYDKNMKGVRVIDFGGTKGVYINGKLNILPKTTNTSPETLKRRQLAKEFKTVDLNRDGEISPDEINSVIKLYQAGSSLYSKEMMNKLIDIFLE
jgi:Ca2+-binding EF-hand superfamily protein